MVNFSQEEMAARLKSIRKTNGLSLKEMGDCIGTDRDDIKRYESGLRRPSYEILVQYIEKFNVDINYVLTGVYAADRTMK